MPIRPLEYVDQPFVANVGSLAQMLQRGGDLAAQQALAQGASRAATWNDLARAFTAYQMGVREKQMQAAALAQRDRERQEANALKLLEIDERKAERAEQNRIRLETEGRQKRSDALARAAATQPGILSSEQADDLRDSGRVQILDGAPVLMRTPDQVRQSGLDAQARAVAEAAAADRKADNDRMTAALTETRRHNQAMEARQPRPLAREVVQGPNGPLLVDKETGRTEPIMGPDNKPLATPLSATERMDSRKFSKAAPILRGIGELSERINTLNGVIAKAAGEVERQKARVNLNDDVAEYEALISGFTPMIARALGHQGVLTEQDVQSVKALFPRPGDSKSLRDRKINRMMSIIGELEGVEGVEGVAPPAKKNPNRD